MENLEFLIDVLNILPENIVCFFQAPSLEDDRLLKMNSNEQSDLYIQIKLDALKKKEVIDILKGNLEIVYYFQYVEIKSQNDKKIFEAWDGVEYSTFSKNIKIPGWFNEKYFDLEMYNISEDW